MKQLFSDVFDFSVAGLGAGVKRFFISLLKTAGAAAVAYILLKLDSVHVTDFVKPMFAGYALMLFAAIRAVFAFLEEWLLTKAPVTVDATVVPDGTIA